MSARSQDKSLVHALFEARLAGVGPCLAHVRQAPLRDSLKRRFVEDEVPTWGVRGTLSPFTRRVMAIEWHPLLHDVVAFASHGGDIQLWSFQDSSRDLFLRGLGYGYGCITAMKFHPERPRFVYTTSVDGRFVLQDLEGRQSSVYLDTQDISYWWCSLDLCRQHDVVFVGGNTGRAVLLDSAGEVVCRYRRLHRGKIKYAEFCSSGGGWLLATASVDHTVALWDIRMLRERPGNFTDTPEPLSTLKHSAPINSAIFDPHTGSQLLTTTQNSQLHVYDAATNWGDPSIIVSHPHRHFQHMTDIVATWHPIHRDLCIVGRYPEKDASDQTRSVDLIDIGNGERIRELSSPSLKGIIVLNKFSRCGRWLASGMGYHCLLWGAELDSHERESLRRQRGQGGRPRDGENRRRGGTARKRKRDSNDDSEVAKKSKKKMTVVVAGKRKGAT